MINYDHKDLRVALGVIECLLKENEMRINDAIDCKRLSEIIDLNAHKKALEQTDKLIRRAKNSLSIYIKE